MPRFYIDSDDDTTLYEDIEGMEFGSVEEARKAALMALPEMLKDRILDGDQRDFSVGVRDDQRRLIYRAGLKLMGEWCEPTAKVRLRNS